MDLAKYRALFIEEASDHLDEMTRAIGALERPDCDEEPAACIDTLFRMSHSIKGMAASLDLEAIASLAHALEDGLEPARAVGDLSGPRRALVYETLDALESMIQQVADGAAPSAREELVPRLRAEGDAPPAPTSPARNGALPLPPTRARTRTVRVHAEAVDRFLATVGELMQRTSRLERIHRDAPLWEGQREFDEELAGMQNAVRELRRRALEIRTTAVRRVLDRLPRVASELGRGLGKRVTLELYGEDVEVDRAVLDHLDDPLLHLVRNAVDHGIEAPEARVAAGKPATGRIRVRAGRHAGRLSLRIEDDGGGVDAAAVRRKAVERGLYPEALAEDLPLERVAELLFEPGLSTRSDVSELSGRGVGLDAVKRAIEVLGGTISVASEPGSGTAFDIDLPSMVALQRVLILQIWNERVALPVGRVDAVVDVAEGVVEDIGSETFFVWKDEPIPLVDLAKCVGLPPLPRDRGAIALVASRDFRFGVLAHRAVQEFEVFVREVPEAIASNPALGGVAILPDGAPVFLLELGAIVETDL